ncbi:MAG: D-serine ammonia-lyase [Verrucomicrobiia bacterium]
MMPSVALEQIRHARPLFWANPGWKPAKECLGSLSLTRDDMLAAEERLRRFAPLLAECFPELKESGGIIESPLVPCPRLASWLAANDGIEGSFPLYVKADHALPVAGSIKARGGIYAVLHFAERVAIESGLMDEGADYRQMLKPKFRELFGGYELSVGSTGNLGLSIGIMGSALGFRVTVHMSREAKDWKKERLRRRGVNVVEYASDYTAACVEARRIAAENPRIHFIDDENSVELFLGYSVALLRLRDQLAEAGVRVDDKHPLFLYLPCGVGGAPGGITFAARQVFGDFAHGIFIEPVQAPCMALGLITGRHSAVSVYEFGLTLKTDADGLAVSCPSRFVGNLMEPLLSGCVTLTDQEMYRDLLALHETEGMEVEPSSSSACGGLKMLYGTEEGRAFLKARNLPSAPSAATHILWTTGGSFVPSEQHAAYRSLARHPEYHGARIETGHRIGDKGAAPFSPKINRTLT